MGWGERGQVGKGERERGIGTEHLTPALSPERRGRKNNRGAGGLFGLRRELRS